MSRLRGRANVPVGRRGTAVARERPFLADCGRPAGNLEGAIRSSAGHQHCPVLGSWASDGPRPAVGIKERQHPGIPMQSQGDHPNRMSRRGAPRRHVE